MKIIRIDLLDRAGLTPDSVFLFNPATAWTLLKSAFSLGGGGAFLFGVI